MIIFVYTFIENSELFANEVIKLNVQSVDFYYNIKSLVYDVVINEIKHRCIFIIFIATKVCTGEKSIKKPLYNPRAIPSLNSYFPFILHALEEGKKPRASRLRYIPIEEEERSPLRDDRKFAETLYSDPFESAQISAERPLDRARSPENRSRK